MPALHDLQSDFARAMLDPERAVPGGVTSHKTARPKKRFDVYRNNVVLSLITALADQFPATARLLGRDRFQQAAKAFIVAHPPKSPVLMEYGEEFGGFLEGFAPLRQFPYLADVAHLEWLWARAFHAADAAPVAPDELAAIAPEELGLTRFSLHPSLGLLSSAFPAVSIWHTNIVDDEVESIQIDGGGEDALVLRVGLDVEVRRLPPGTLALFAALREGKSLSAAAEQAAAAAPQFDLQLALTDLLQSGAIAAFETP